MSVYKRLEAVTDAHRRFAVHTPLRLLDVRRVVFGVRVVSLGGLNFEIERKVVTDKRGERAKINIVATPEAYDPAGAGVQDE